MSEVLDHPPQRLQGPPRKTDWFAVITELQTKHGIAMLRIGKAMELALTESMLRAYRAGAEPAHWRGNLLLLFWCEVTGKHADQRPMMDVIRGHRAAGRIRPSHPSMQAQRLIDIRDSRPEGSAPTLASQILKRKPGRPRKEPA